MVMRAQAEQRRRREPSKAGKSRCTVRKCLVPVVAFWSQEGPGRQQVAA